MREGSQEGRIPKIIEVNSHNREHQNDVGRVWKHLLKK